MPLREHRTNRNCGAANCKKKSRASSIFATSGISDCPVSSALQMRGPASETPGARNATGWERVVIVLAGWAQTVHLKIQRCKESAQKAHPSQPQVEVPGTFKLWAKAAAMHKVADACKRLFLQEFADRVIRIGMLLAALSPLKHGCPFWPNS